ncbi:MAG: Hsp70 family protein, partial [Candidatus Aminicenantes bacterium]|nr:Hsp70 family protein [Candidatus Aminicenantes bacterium]
DANGILHVSAKDMGTGKQQAITITGHSGLDDQEIDNMVKDAEAHATEDKQRRELVDIKNQADQMIYNMEKLLRENKDKIPAEEASRVQAEIDNTKKVIESDNVEAIKQAMEKLSQASHKLTEIMYQQATQQQAQQQAAGSQDYAGGQAETQGQKTQGESEEEVIDAEVVDEEKK